MTEKQPVYMANVDVSCREEGADGALLFNPDTDQILVINVTGLLVWQALSQPHTQAEIVRSLLEQCSNAPEDQVHQDVSEFIQALLDKGFVGVVQGATP